MACIRLTKTNDSQSLLFNKLLNVVNNEAKADEEYSFIDTKKFNKMFGDYKDAYLSNYEGKYSEMKDRVDPNGEPSLLMDNLLNKTYFLDKQNEKVFYPFTEQGINQYFEQEDIDKFTEILALKYYERYVNLDFDSLEFTNKDKKSLVDFIKAFIEHKVNYLTNHSDLDLMTKGIALENSQRYLTDWHSNVLDYFSKLKISYDEYDDSVAKGEEAIKGDLFRKESFTKSTKSNVNNNIKLLLSLIHKDKKNSFDEYNFIPYAEIYSDLNKTLANKIELVGESMYDIYMDIVLNLTTNKEYYNVLYDYLVDNKDNPIFRSQFSTAFNLNKNKFLGTILEISEEGKLTHTAFNLSDVTSRKKAIIDQWEFNSKLTDNKIAALIEKTKKQKNKFNKKSKDIENEADLTSSLNKVKDILELTGVRFTMKGFDMLLSGLKVGEQDILFKKNELSKFYTQLLYALNFKLKNMDDSLFRNQSSFSRLAEVEAFYMEEGSDASIFSLGQTKWVYSYPSFLSMKIDSWKKDPQILINHYNSNPFTQSSHWMEFLTAAYALEEDRIKESRENLEKIELFIFSSLQQDGKAYDGVDNKTISFTDSLVDYVNKLLAFKKEEKAIHKTALAGGKNTEYQLHMGNDPDYLTIESKAEYKNGRVETSDEVVDIFYNYFKGDYETIRKEFDYIEENENNPSKLKPNYHTGKKNALKSMLFPSLSVKFDENNEVVLPEVEIYDDRGYPLYEDLDEVKSLIKGKIKDFLSEGILNTHDTLFKYGLIKYDGKISKKNVGFDDVIFDAYTKDTADSSNSDASLSIASDLFINSVISQVEYSKMFTGNVAYYKDYVDYKKRVGATYTDGLYLLNLSQDEQFFNVAVISSATLSAVNIEGLKKHLPKRIYKFYEKNIDSNDAQAWITPERWKFIVSKIKGWNSIRESAYKKMFEKNPEFTKKELKVLSQPLKGVYFDNVNDKPVFLKYSQAVLVPSLVKGTQLEYMYNAMTTKDGKVLNFKDQVHEVIDNSGIKVGFNTPNTIHDVDGNISKNISLDKIQLKNASWKLQQDLPTKGVKPTTIGTQIQKMVFQGLAFNTKEIFYVGDTTMSSKQLILHINSLYTALSSAGLSDVINMLDVNDEGKINNEEYIYNSIIKQLSKRDDIPKNFINALKAGLSPYGIPGGFQLFQNVFSTLVNGNIIDIKSNGGGFIQISDFGLTNNEAKSKGVRYTPWSETTRLKAPEIYVNEKGIKKTKHGGILVPGSLIAKYVPNYRSLSDAKLFGTKENNYDDGIIDRRILSNIIGYRIPNQGLASNDALEVVGILPEEEGDAVVAYLGITTKTGSDYDIDKMYLMIPSFKPMYSKEDNRDMRKFVSRQKFETSYLQSELRNIGYNTDAIPTRNSLESYFAMEFIENGNEDYDIYNKYYENNEGRQVIKLKYSTPLKGEDGLSELPLSKQSKDVVRNKLIEAYTGVFLNPKVNETMMKPIDSPIFSDDINNLFPLSDKPDLMEFDAITDLNNKFEFSSGEAGLGQNVNSLVDYIRGSMAYTGFNDYYLGVGKAGKEGNTIFDSEWSVTLSEKELKDYVKSFNKEAKKNGEDTTTIEQVKENEKILLSESMMALVNAFVDIVKNPFIVRGNWVTQTNGIGFMLLRAGVHPYYVNAFMGQPIIKSYIEFISKNKSKLIGQFAGLETKFLLNYASELIDEEESIEINGIKMFKKALFNSIYVSDLIMFIGSKSGDNFKKNIEKFRSFSTKKLYKKFKVSSDSSAKQIKKIKKLDKNFFETFYDVMYNTEAVDFKKLTLKKLRNQITNNKDIGVQLSVLQKFKEWKIQADKLDENVIAGKLDVNGKGKNITSTLINLNRIDKVLYNEDVSNNFYGFIDKLIYEKEPTLLGSYHGNIEKIYDIMTKNEKFFFTASKGAVSTFNAISSYINGDILTDERLGDLLENEYTSYLMSGFKPLRLSKAKRDDLIKNMPNRVAMMQAELDNYFLNKLTFKKGEVYDFVSMPPLKLSSSEQDKITNYWRELLYSHPEFAEDLIKYAFLTSGFNNSINQFHKLIPYEWFNKNRFNSYLKTILPKLDGRVDYAFINQFFRHHRDNYRIVSNLVDSQITSVGENDNRTAFQLEVQDIKDLKYFYKLKQEDNRGNVYYKYYKLHGYSKVSGKFVYLRSSLLGGIDNKGNKIVEYSLINGIKDKAQLSILENNKLTGLHLDVDLYNKIKKSKKIDKVEEKPMTNRPKLVNKEDNNKLTDKTDAQLSLFEDENPFKCK